MEHKPKVVLDTNVFLVAIPEHSSFHVIYQKLIDDEFEMLISNEILMEYEEKIKERYRVDSANASLDFLLLLPNIIKSEPYFRWNLVEVDADDNKFVDCAVAGNADLIISNDRHLRRLNENKFPPLKILSAEEFVQFLLHRP